MAESAAGRPLGLRLIIGYKIVKAVVVLGLAIWLTASSDLAVKEARHLIALLAEHPGWLHRLAMWLSAHVTQSAIHVARIVAWADGFSTALEAALLLSGKVWGEWMVVGGVALLLPLEVHAVWLHPKPTRIAVLIANALIVAYLARRRLRHDKPAGGLRTSPA